MLAWNSLYSDCCEAKLTIKYRFRPYRFWDLFFGLKNYVCYAADMLSECMRWHLHDFAYYTTYAPRHPYFSSTACISSACRARGTSVASASLLLLLLLWSFGMEWRKCVCFLTAHSRADRTRCSRFYTHTQKYTNTRILCSRQRRCFRRRRMACLFIRGEHEHQHPIRCSPQDNTWTRRMHTEPQLCGWLNDYTWLGIWVFCF